MENKVQFKVYGRYALFTDPITRIGGEKYSYQVPTYQALKGIIESAYWKPTIVWIIDRVRVVKPIRSQSRNVKPLKYQGGHSSLAIYSYLFDVEYQVEAHFEWNTHREDMVQDQNENKHYFVAKRMIERGGRRDIFLGTRECQAYLEPCRFGEGQGFYDEYGELDFGVMFHGFDYPDETGEGKLYARLWRPKMVNGIIDFIRPDECNIRRYVRDMTARKILSSGTAEEGLLDGYEQGGDEFELDAKALRDI